MEAKPKTAKQKIFSVLLLFLTFAGAGFFTAKYTGKTPEGICPSEELLKSDLSSMKFSFEGNELEFPLTVREFKRATRWNIEHTNGREISQKELIPPHSVITSDLRFKSAGRSVFFKAVNDTDEPQQFLDCTIAELIFPNNNTGHPFWRRTCTMIMPKGIIMADTSSTRQDIIDVYGKPSEEEESMIAYSFGDNYISFVFEAEETAKRLNTLWKETYPGRLVYITISNGSLPPSPLAGRR